MDLFGITVVTGLACLGIAGVVALSRPIDNWRQVATRLAVLGLVLTIGMVIGRAIVNAVAGG
jgi:hypothetical protein